MARKQSNDILVLNVLEKYTDESHYLNASEVAELIHSEYGLTIERRTIYTTIDLLIGMGYEIETFKENNKGYRLKNRILSNSDLLKLAHSVHSANFFSGREASDLIKRVYQVQSIYAKNTSDQLYIENKVNKTQQNYFKYLELLNDAIIYKKVIQFEYLKYNFNKELVSTQRPYIVTPHKLAYFDDHYHIIVYNEVTGKLMHYRLDRICNVSYVKKISSSQASLSDINTYYNLVTNLIPVQSDVFKVKCHNSILDQAIEKFENNITVTPIDQNYFIAEINTSIDNLLYWSFQYINYTVVLEPEALKEQIKKTLFRATNMYV